mmetsp:Transcript_17838/g.53471  ORF Transcript_17838/g.53471 Transcript_17838/m.53471 type:complete len:249 (-) Transcript_17838:1297-2043(-)
MTDQQPDAVPLEVAAGAPLTDATHNFMISKYENAARLNFRTSGMREKQYLCKCLRFVQSEHLLQRTDFIVGRTILKHWNLQKVTQLDSTHIAHPSWLLQRYHEYVADLVDADGVHAGAATATQARAEPTIDPWLFPHGRAAAIAVPEQSGSGSDCELDQNSPDDDGAEVPSPMDDDGRCGIAIVHILRLPTGSLWAIMHASREVLWREWCWKAGWQVMMGVTRSVCRAALTQQSFQRRAWSLRHCNTS